MQEAIRQPTDGSEATDGLAASALRAESWSGEPFLRPGEDPAEVLGEGHARREALDDALAEMAAGLRSPSAEWKVRYSLMLGLERVIADHPARLASGTELRRHQIDALAGMLTELIARNERHEENGNGDGLNGDDEEFEEELDEPIAIEASDDDLEPEEHARERPGRGAALPLPASDRVGQDDRRGRVRRGRPDDGDPDPHAPAPAREPVHERPDHRGLRRPFPPRDRGRLRSRSTGTRSRSRPTPGSRATSARSRGRRTSSSSATRRTPRSARRRARRSAASPSRSTSG